MPKKLTKRQMVGKLAKSEGGKSQARMGDVMQIVAAIRLLLKKEALEFKLGKRKSMPLAKMLFSDASKALAKK